MIRFSCEHCGYKIAVEDAHVGKRGKCPACGTILTVPAESTLIEFDCGNCGRRLAVPKIQSGKKVVCPKCEKVIFVPAAGETPAVSIGIVRFACSTCKRQLDEPESSRGKLVECPHCHNYIAVPSTETPAQELEVPVQPAAQVDKSEEHFEQMQKDQGASLQEPEPLAERKLPWFIDIFLYPTSNGGLLTLATLILLRLITDFATVVLMCCAFGGILSLIIRIVLVWSYTYWYFSECVRDSANGGLRAPDIAGRMPGLGDMFWQWARLFACFAIFLGPVVFYRGYIYFASIEINNVVLLSLLAYGAFLFPMNVLAVVMFDSVNGMNPVLIVRSIISTFLQYCGLFILFYVLSILFITIFSMVLRISSQTQILSRGFFSYILFNLLVAYALLVTGHLLGRFYWLYQKKLNWDV